MGVSTGAVDALRAAIGESAVRTDAETLVELSADSSPRSKKAAAAGAALATADLVARPTSTHDVVAVVRWANQHEVAVTVRGAGSGVVGSGLPLYGGVVLDLRGMSEIGPVDTVNRLVTVGAGTLGSTLEDHLAAYNLTSGHYPQSLHLASVGGWVAMRGSGTFSSMHGNIEDRVADLEVVLPTGEVLTTRSSPRASEGLDLKQVFIGSEGMLGVITSVTLRLVPLPASRRFAAVRFDTLDAALDTMRETLTTGVRPAVVRIYDPVESKAKHARFSDREGWLLVLLFDGAERLTQVQQQITQGIAESRGGEDL
ncbi:MAG: FAD-binding oxidoreductase, partial [Nocardioidaceae bacterium]